MQDLERKLYTNPHSGHAAWGSDISAMDCEAEARALTLALCHATAEDYECIFTSGATGAPEAASYLVGVYSGLQWTAADSACCACGVGCTAGFCQGATLSTQLPLLKRHL